MPEKALLKEDFGKDFKWGVSTAAYQIEGAYDCDGKGPSIWDTFSGKKGKILSGHHGRIACDFYNRYSEDIQIVRELNIPNLRFSFAWSRIMPEGRGTVNQKGIDFYNRLIDKSLEQGITPWPTIYHWDLPQALESLGGWTNRDVVEWFSDYAEICAKNFGDRVKYWMVMNEPVVYTGAGYFLGVHAPGRTGLKNFLPAVHHSVLAIASGGKRIREILPASAEIGTTFSCSLIEPQTQKPKDIAAAARVDALLNRLFIEPLCGLGYPSDDLPVLQKINKYFYPGDEHRLSFDFDFIGVQNYTREIVRHSMFTPYLKAALVKAKDRKVPLTAMGWEVYPPSIHAMIRKFNGYEGVKKIYITENGAAFPDQLEDGRVTDKERIDYLNDVLREVIKAKNDGLRVDGYFIWTLTDNFEWAEGYHPRFGLVHIDFDTQVRTIKESGKWYRDFLK